MDEPTKEFYYYIQSIDEATIREINVDIKGTNYERLSDVIDDIVQKIGKVHNSSSIDETYQDELANCLMSKLFGLNPKNIRFSQLRSFLNLSNLENFKEGMSSVNRKLSRLSKVYKENPNISTQVVHFLNSRVELINNLASNANELNRNNFIAATSRLFGYALGIIRSLDAYFGENLIMSLFRISPFLAHLARHFLVAAAYFAPICIIISFAEYLRCIYILRRLIKLLEKDRELFKPISKYFLEKEAMQGIIAELFIESVDEDVVINVEESLLHLTSMEKIFAAVLVSNMKKYPSCIQDGRFLYINYLFSITPAAKEWYNRMRYHIDSVDCANDVRVLDDSLLHLKMIHYVSSMPIQALVFFFKPSILPGIVLSGLHSLCFFSEIKNFKNVNKCLLSQDLKNLASLSKRILKSMRIPLVPET